MKIISMLLVAVFCFTGLVFAEPIDMSEVLSKAPEIKEGVLYSFDDSQFKPSTSFEMVTFGDGALELGGIAQDDEMFLAVSWHLVNLKDDKGITTPILDLINIDIAIGYGLKQIGDDNEGDLLLGGTLVDWKF